MAHSSRPNRVGPALFESGVKWLKASKEQIVFVDVLGDATTLASTEDPDERISLETLFSQTLDFGGETNETGDQFFKFRSCKTVLVSDGSHLHAILEAAPGRSLRVA